MKYVFSTAAELAETLRVSRSFLRDRRNSGDWREGIHWNYLNPRNHRAGIRYNETLCLNWLACKGTAAHDLAVQTYLNTLQPQTVQTATGSE